MKSTTKTVLYKAKISGLIGDHYLVVELPSYCDIQDAKEMIFNRMLTSDKMVTPPVKTNRTLIKGMKALHTVQPYYIIAI
jgi:hypothetical protein